jgi:O-antigen/teichoic acid export membrane protein
MSLFYKTLNGIKWTAIDSASSAILQFIRVIILTKILSATDFGIMTMTLVITSFSNIFMNFGVSSAIIYKKDNSNEELSSLYWLNVFLGIIIYSLLFSFSEMISYSIFNEKELSKILKIISFVFIFSGFSVQFKTLLKKYLKFDVLAKINITSFLISFIVTIVLAFKGFGVYSLVYGYVTNSIIHSLLLVPFGLNFNKPKLFFSWTLSKPYINFGIHQLFTRLIENLGSQLDKLLIGIFLSSEILGFYNVSKILIEKPVNLIKQIYGKMAFPVLTTIEDTDRLRKWTISSCKIIFLFISPVFLILLSFPENVINILYGPKWLPASQFLILLCVLSFFRIFRTSFGPLLLSRGQVKTQFLYVSINVFLSSCVFGVLIQSSITDALYGLILLEFFLIQAINYHLILRPILNLSFLEFIITIFKVSAPIFVSIVATLVLYNNLPNENLIFIVVSIFIGQIFLLIPWYFFNYDTFREFMLRLKNKPTIN